MPKKLSGHFYLCQQTTKADLLKKTEDFKKMSKKRFFEGFPKIF